MFPEGTRAIVAVWTIGRSLLYYYLMSTIKMPILKMYFIYLTHSGSYPCLSREK